MGKGPEHCVGEGLVTDPLVGFPFCDLDHPERFGFGADGT